MADGEADLSKGQAPENVVPSVCLSEELDADIFLYSGLLYRSFVDSFLDASEKHSHHKNIAIVLSTNGGDPDAAFRLIRCLKATHERLILYVFGPCKSAGTLVALGADDIIMSKRGEFGPLDIQIPKQDEWVPLSSGLDIQVTLDALRVTAFKLFEYQFLQIKECSGWHITTKTAADIAATLTVGLLSPITAQIDPVRLGEIYRAIDIAFQYGCRLRPNPDIVLRLINDYPSHGFVIDYAEAKDLFGNVREPNTLECAFEVELREFVKQESGLDCLRLPGERPIIAYISPDTEEMADASNQVCANDRNSTEGEEAVEYRQDDTVEDHSQGEANSTPSYRGSRKGKSAESKGTDCEGGD